MLAVLGKKKGLCIAAAVVVIAVGILVGVMLSGRDRPVEAGQSVVVTVTANSYTDMYGYQFELSYDEEQLEYTRALTSTIEDIQTIFSRDMGGV